MYKYLKYKNWYSQSRARLIKKYGQDYKLMAGLIASTSPRFQIKRNINTAENIYRDFKAGRYDFLSYAVNNEKAFCKKYKILKAHYHNILKVLECYTKDGDFKKLVLSGLKVKSFFQNLIGNYEAVTLDIWMMRYFNYNKDYLTIRPYKRFTRIVRRLAEREGLKPCELQAILWTKIRYEHGFKPLNFAKFI